MKRKSEKIKSRKEKEKLLINDTTAQKINENEREMREEERKEKIQIIIKCKIFKLTIIIIKLIIIMKNHTQ